jgi:prepilin-type N-terminal cleavage/methylation domain-containing protein
MSSPASPRGFTLIETVVATSLLVTALAGLAQLFMLSAQLTRQASASGVALLAAQEKLESLRGLAFSYDEGGAPITAPNLEPSASSSLDADREPHVEWLDASGQPHTDARTAVFVRRWRISTVGDSPPESIAIEVCVFRAPAARVDHRAADACLSILRTRQP